MNATTTPLHYQPEEQTQSYNSQDNKRQAVAEKDHHQPLKEAYYHLHS